MEREREYLHCGHECLPKGPVCEWAVCAGSMSVCVWLQVLSAHVCVVS